MVAAIFAAVTIGATTCSGITGRVVAPSVPASKGPGSSSPNGPNHASNGGPASGPGAKGPQLARSTPVRLQISAIGVDTTLMRLGLRSDGSMEVPVGGFPAGWYTGGPAPGQLGPAVIAGHVDMKGPGVFFNLHKVKTGDQVAVTRADGRRPVFRVTKVAQYLKNEFPTQLVYGNLDHAGLRLITCGGTFNSKTGHYEDNLVVFADLVAPAR
jgi:LPXTG-site transpeptidase (sortase) family protein